MDSPQNVKLDKHFRTIFVVVFLCVTIAILYYKFAYVPKKQKEYVIQHTPAVEEERDFFTSEENQEMRAAYQELMLQKSGKKVELQKLSASSSPSSTVKESR